MATTPTVLCLNHLPEKRIAPLNGMAMETMKDVHSHVEYMLMNTGHFPRNVDLRYRNARHSYTNTEWYRIGSFELYGCITWIFDYSYQSSALWIRLLQVMDVPEIGGRQWLCIKISKESVVTLNDLWEIITDFISGFMLKHGIKWREVATKEEGIDPYLYHWPVLSEWWDTDEKTEFLFAISSVLKGDTEIQFTDLTPVHPDFLHEFLLYIDERCTEIYNK